MVTAMCCALATLLVVKAASFAVEELLTDRATIDKLYAAAFGEQRDAMASRLLLPAIQRIADKIVLEQGDMQLHESFPNNFVETDCDKSVELRDTRAVGKLAKATVMRFGSSDIWNGAPVFIDAVFDGQLEVNTDVRLTVGRSIFHRCTEIARKTVNLDLVSYGRVGLGVTLNITSTNIEQVDGDWAMVFTFSVSVVGTVLDWNLDGVKVDRCYIIQILGHPIGSICGAIREEVLKRKAQFMNKVTMLQASPKMQAKLERAVRARVGSRVVVPLRLAAAEGAAAAAGLGAAEGLGIAPSAAAGLSNITGASTRAAEALGLAGTVPGAREAERAAYGLIYS